jgi:hypothetical protein
MQSKKARKTRPKSKKRAKQRSPADPKERLKPISLHGMELEDVLRRLVTPPGKG